jgi:hypothetical protein
VAIAISYGRQPIEDTKNQVRNHEVAVAKPTSVQNQHQPKQQTANNATTNNHNAS